MSTTNFFADQKRARTQSALWRITFLLATACVAASVGLTGAAVFKSLMQSAGSEPPQWSRNLSLIISAGVFCLIFLTNFVHSRKLNKSGVHTLLTHTGARRIQFGTTNLSEKKLINVTQEMALASGVRLPALYILPRDESINAFTVGLTPQNTAIALTESALVWLTRSELQGVVAHEFAHILNADVTMNTRFIPFARSFLFISAVGWTVALLSPLLLMPIIMSILLLDLSAGPILIFTAIAISAALMGLLGKITLLLMQRFHSRTREWLADAAAVQFTRDPSSLRGALEKVDKNQTTELFGYKKFKHLEHMFFVSGRPSIFNELLAIHPPIVARIRALGHRDYTSPSQKIYFRVNSEVASDNPMAPALNQTKNDHQTVTRPKSDHIAQMVNMSWALRSQERQTKGSLARAKKLLYAAHSKLDNHLDTPEGITTILFALAIRLSSGKSEDVRLCNDLLTPQQIQLLNERFLPLFNEFPFCDCLAFVPLACLKTFAWSSLQKNLLLTKVISLFKRDNNISAKELSFILTVGRELLTDIELRSFAHSGASNPYQELTNLLAFICHAGLSNEISSAQAAYNIGLKTLGLTSQKLPILQNIPPESLLRAIGEICAAPDKTKRLYLSALLRAVFADQRVHEDEFHILRAVCTCLNVPVPLEAQQSNNVEREAQ